MKPDELEYLKAFVQATTPWIENMEHMHKISGRDSEDFCPYCGVKISEIRKLQDIIAKAIL